jgi:cathepsin A (carboxypeptidase C)
MRALATALVLGVAAAVVPPQQVLQAPAEDARFLAKPLHKFHESFDALDNKASAMLEEVLAMFPDALDKMPSFLMPKKHNRRPDSEWDHIVRGVDVQRIWVEGEDGQQHRENDGKLDVYDLRVKVVDPSVLGVDPGVKQYSGYLDNNEQDKHLFYCNILTFFTLQIYRLFANWAVQGSLNLVTIQRMTPSYFG